MVSKRGSEGDLAQAAVMAKSGEQLAMYTTTHCPYCADVRAWFKANNIAYRECNIDTSAKCANELARLGAEGVPTMIYRDKLMVGFDSTWVRDVLLQAGAAPNG